VIYPETFLLSEERVQGFITKKGISLFMNDFMSLTTLITTPGNVPHEKDGTGRKSARVSFFHQVL
jgi:hypothetical protein